jgi:hypothetical protein
MNNIGAAAYRTILHVFLVRPCRQIDGHHYLLAARIANVAGLVLHRFLGSGNQKTALFDLDHDSTDSLISGRIAPIFFFSVGFSITRI